MGEGPTISTHVLDTERGMPGAGYRIMLWLMRDEEPILVGDGTTDDDGRIRRLLHGDLVAGEYQLDVEIGGAFFRRASLTFTVQDPGRSYHVPLLLSTYSLMTYRGS